MTITLYQITDRYQQALLLLSDPELPPQVINDTLDAIEGEFESKALAVAAFIGNLELEASAVREVEERMTRRRKALENRAESLREYLHLHMQRLNVQTVKSAELTIKIKRNPPRVVIDNEALLPDDYKEVELTLKVRKQLVQKALGEGRLVPGAHLESTTRLDIR
jgi:Siphovirus Gp157